jgi:hypothetical protein
MSFRTQREISYTACNTCFVHFIRFLLVLIRNDIQGWIQDQQGECVAGLYHLSVNKAAAYAVAFVVP